MGVPWIGELAASPWLLVVLYALVVADAFLVILPSETAVVALAALAAASGSPFPWPVVAVAAAGAVSGDLVCYLLGRRIGLDRWGWQQRGRSARAITRARETIGARPAVLIFTARYVPFARVAVNLTAGAAGLRLRRFLPLAACAGVGWSLYNVGVGSIAGATLADRPIVALVVSVLVAIGLGLALDGALGAVSRARARRSERTRIGSAP